MTLPREKITFQFKFPPEVQAGREPVLRALDRAMVERTVEVVREAQDLARVWLMRHPEDYAVWDAGEPIAMLADALEIVADEERQGQEREEQAHGAWDAPAVAA